MPILEQYDQFAGTHWETGSVRNVLAHQGIVAPHTGKAYSEAMLLGISGGITFGYFTFAYQGYDPQCNILTRNTFAPWETMLARLGVVQTIQQTAKADKGLANLLNALEEGMPAIVWPDMWSLPYNALPYDDGMWGAFPLVVYGIDDTSGDVVIADRAAVPLRVTATDFAAARGRIKKDKFRVTSLDLPGHDKLASAVRLGIADCIKLFTERPPKGSQNNFGLNGLEHWANMLITPTARQSWAKGFPGGRALVAGLTSAYDFAFLFGKDLAQDAERGRYAQFLEEAALVLERPALDEAATLFRAAGALWQELPALLLPDNAPILGASRALLWQRHRLFLEQGGASLAERQALTSQLAALLQSAEDDFPLEQSRIDQMLEAVSAQLSAIRAAEGDAVRTLQKAMG